MTPKHIFIINPAAGRCDCTNAVAAAVHALSQTREMDYEILTTLRPRHAAQLVRQKAEEYPDRPLRFYACGGDGTLNEVAAGAAGLDHVAFTHYPTGSGNDFIKSFGADGKAFHDLEALVAGDIQDLDYMESDCGICLNMFSVGVDARVADGMQKYKRIPLLAGRASYHLSTVESILRGISQPYGVEVDGQYFSGNFAMVLAANGRFYGGGACPVPEADPTDGKLDVLLVRGMSVLQAAKVIGAYERGFYRRYPQYITHFAAKTLTVYHQDGKDMTINLDGEIVHSSRVSLRLADKKLHLIIPRGAVLLPPRIVE